MGLKIHLVRFLVLRTIHGTLVAEVGINSRRVFGGGIACIASADFLSKIHGLKIHGGSAGYLCWLSLWVRPCVYACVGACIRVRPCVYGTTYSG